MEDAVNATKQHTGTGAGGSTFVSDEGSTAGVTSVGLSSGWGTAAVVIGSDIMLWESQGAGKGEEQ